MFLFVDMFILGTARPHYLHTIIYTYLIGDDEHCWSGHAVLKTLRVVAMPNALTYLRIRSMIFGKSSSLAYTRSARVEQLVYIYI